MNSADGLKEEVSKIVKGDVLDDAAARETMSRDTSLFKKVPSLVVYPKDAADVSALVRFVHTARTEGQDISVTARSAGTDMSGGPLTSSIVAVFTKYMNHITSVSEGEAITEPGVYYRDFEKATLRRGYLLPSYPASRELCAMGGIVNNNSGGERTLKYGKTEKYVHAIDAVLSDGSRATFTALTPSELESKKQAQTLEGSIYRNMDALIKENEADIIKAKPHVSKNSAGYALWNIVDKEKQTFDLSKLLVGAQGTLALMTSARLGLVKPAEHRAMLIVFLSDISILPDIVHRVLAFKPESFESYDDHTLKLAVHFLPQILSQLGIGKALRLGLSFLPEVGMVIAGGVPKLVLMAEFAEETHEEALRKALHARSTLEGLNVRTRIAKSETAAAKYWTMRRESFALLRKNLRGFYASPFIDDFVVPPETYPEFLPELNELLSHYKLVYTIAGHIGDGNFHIIPLMNLADPASRLTVTELAPLVYELIGKYGGSITGEHNDGIIRTPYLGDMYGAKILALFKETKNIFDPLGVLNPGKKVGGTIEDIKRYMIKKS